jgi:putative acetyltransferase
MPQKRDPDTRDRTQSHPAIAIRPETAADAAAIRDVTRRAFEGRWYTAGNEQDIVDALRRQNALTISLVAEQAGIIVGHVAFSPARSADGASGWYTLGPVSVAPEVQRRGIGSALIESGIDRLRQLAAVGCIVVGDTNYYSRFGFRPAPQLAPPGAPQDHFMIVCFDSSPPEAVLHFHPAFDVQD